MKRNKKGVMPNITRATYNSVKKFDRQQFTAFCADLYGFGYEDGRESVSDVDLATLYEAIVGIKGIGPKKLEEIKARLEPFFREGAG